ncbi:50S ribosomal protein L13, partial [Candidatus Dojkabacteria bacterium]|nr:50S ribosomal protein L13 [Candidatus Dojkabacteria bacterium]
GTLATTIAQLLLGKHDPKSIGYLSPRTKVIVINSDELDIPANKKISKLYTRYSGYPGGLKVFTLGEMMEKDSTEVIRKAVRGMLPKGSRGREILATNLYVYAGSEHEHQAQQEQIVTIDKQNFKI